MNLDRCQFVVKSLEGDPKYYVNLCHFLFGVSLSSFKVQYTPWIPLSSNHVGSSLHVNVSEPISYHICNIWFPILLTLGIMLLNLWWTCQFRLLINLFKFLSLKTKSTIQHNTQYYRGIPIEKTTKSFLLCKIIFTNRFFLLL